MRKFCTYGKAHVNLKLPSSFRRKWRRSYSNWPKDQFPGTLLSVSKVRVSPDLGVAKIYVSIFPVAKTKETFDFLQLNNAKLRGALGHVVGSQLRVVPELMVYVDDSLEYEENIDRLLRGEGEKSPSNNHR